jgi:hypothetical protein
MKKIQEDRELCLAFVKGPRAKLKAISAVAHIVTKCFLHGGIKVNGPDVRECSFDAALFSQVCKQCNAVRSKYSNVLKP